jgi:hypothetical protein
MMGLGEVRYSALNSTIIFLVQTPTVSYPFMRYVFEGEKWTRNH